MEFDQQFAGYNLPCNGDWSFPSPGATPTAAAFGNHVFQTPKNATFPSHFQDAFSTPQMPSYATPQQPQYSRMTPVQRTQSSSETLRSNFYAGMQAGVMQPVPMPQQMNYAPQVISPGQGMAYQPSPAQPMMQHIIASQQMQTPPPTRGTPGRKVQQPTQVAFGTPSTIAARRFTTPQQQLQQAQAIPQGPYTPVQFPQIQFSPDMYQFNNFGPASAPVMPQTQLLWDQVRSPMAAIPQQASLDDPFAPSIQQSGTWSSVSPAMSQGPIMSFETPAMTSFPVQPPHPRPASAASLPGGFVNNAMTVATSAASLDPSLIYSSPVRPISRSASRTSKVRPDKPVNKRKDSALESKAQKDSVSPADSGPSISGPGLRRSNTVGNPRSGTAQSAISMAESLSRSESMQQIPRTASPLKRIGRTPLRAISEHKPVHRPSVILTVDENGIARTETRRPEPSPTKSIRERYPGLFDSDTSDDEDEDESVTSEQPPSRSASFNFARSEERRAKAARLDPPVENLEGLSIPRTNSALSVKGVTPSRAAVAAAAQLRRKGSLRRTSRSTAGRRNISSSTGSLIDSCSMDMSVESGHDSTAAGAEVHAAQSIWSPPGSMLRPREATLDAHNRRWSMMSFDQQVPQQQPLPRTRAAPLIRCLCGRTEDDGSPLLQCSSCTQWLHPTCTGLDPYQPPRRFTCFLCTKPVAAGFR
ncbi:hypothetical protein LTR78_001203 [Recurvomyces mirabilis]|uniref:PHD-type domain-containing protein n=2 Tax=Recurvomyces mirabilis TaxID=574656 RepID=A0AAE1C5G5_9PEZI|nr:hypothetical protein LTR78_001203 [Recurvomyces mirabilis]